MPGRCPSSSALPASAHLARRRRKLVREFLDDEQERAWLAFLQLHGRVVGELDARLSERHSLSLPAFEILVAAAHSDDPPSIAELAEHVPVSQSQVSRIVSALERRGLLERITNPRDGRSTCARVTDAGVDALGAAAPTYLETVREQFFDRIGAQNVRQFARLSTSTE